MLALAPHRPTGVQGRQHDLLEVLEDFRQPGRQIVIQQHDAGIEPVDTEPVAVALERFEAQFFAVRQFDVGRRRNFRQQGADAYYHAGVAQDFLQGDDVLQVKRVARVVFRYQQHAARIGADFFDCRHRGLNAQRIEFGIEVVEAAGIQVGVDGGQLEAAVAQIHRCIERRGVFLPLGAKPMLDLGHGLEDVALKIEQWAGEGRGEVRNSGHGSS